MAKDAYFAINAIFSIGFLVLAVLISIYHLIATQKNKGNHSSLFAKAFLKSHPSIFLSYILLAIAVLSGLSLTLDSVFTAVLCPAAQYYGPTLYSLFKTNVYLILGCRIWISFKNSMYEYSQKKLTIWSLIIIFWTVFNVIAGNITVKSTIEEHTDDQDTKCIVSPHFIYIIGQALLDLTSMVVNCILFVRPICKLYKLSNDNVSIKKIAVKQCILSVIAVVSSFVAMIGIGTATFITPVFVSFDMLLSTVCVILMYKWNSYITDKTFCCCMPKESKAQIDEKNLTMNVVPSNTDGLSMNSAGSGTGSGSGGNQNAGHSVGKSTTVQTILSVTETNETNNNSQISPKQSQHALSNTNTMTMTPIPQSNEPQYSQ